MRRLSHPGRIVVVQAILGVLCVVAFSYFTPSQGRSAALAGISVVVPQAYYAWVQSRSLNATRLLLHGVFRMLLTGTLMALSIVLVGIAPVEFFLSFIVMQLGYLAK